ncbi:MAG: substrate-binding domain-containing protein [Bacteroidales bacterium]|nr:substrate-binding domain-containing protein [Bacteroidales bacterium]
MGRKYIHFAILFLAGFILLSNCSEKKKVGFLMDESEEGRWVKDKELFIKNVEELGGEVIWRASERDAQKQIELAKEILEEDVQVLVVVPSDLNAAAEIVKLAHQQQVPVISYDRLIKNCNLDFYLSFDNVHVGELQAKYITSVCPKGKYAILGEAVTDNNSFLLRLGQLNVIQPLVEKGDIEIIYDQYVNNWSPEEGYRLMKECLKNNGVPNAVIAANDWLAEGALNALQDAKVDPLPYICGQDAEASACQRIIAGTQTMTVYKPIEAIAAKAAELTMQIILEQKIPKTFLSVNNGNRQVPAILLPAMVVNRETIDLTVVADGYLKEHNFVRE